MRIALKNCLIFYKRHSCLPNDLIIYWLIVSPQLPTVAGKLLRKLQQHYKVTLQHGMFSKMSVLHALLPLLSFYPVLAEFASSRDDARYPLGGRRCISKFRPES